ncbi:MAG: FAD:protein FMN transferase [Kiritimatiellae bacterium]|nr:FAD:protein FMN transferase [Kiritimatiellia bacterium]
MSALDHVLRYGDRAMATTFELMVFNEDPRIAESAATQVFALIDRIEAQISRFQDVSEVAMISRLKPGEVYRVDRETMDLLLISTEICAATGGAFDVTVGSVMDALRTVNHRWSALTEEERQDALATCGMNRLILDPDHFMVSVKPDRLGRPTPLQLDFGAIGKGFVIDLACEMLERDWEMENFLLHGGTSTVAARGSMGDGGEGWTINVGGDWRIRAGIETLRISKGAISGSGFEEQGFHVVDPRKGVAAARHAGAWSYAESAAWADGLSTAFLGMDWKEIESACEACPGCGALVVRDQAEWLDHVRRPVRTCGAFPRH